ncbi:MAG: hypothetical protein QF535_10315, partial [Anaerolineales bacterium]|nr:hypothetical protein [Anaerolineales bacterium]
MKTTKLFASFIILIAVVLAAGCLESGATTSRASGYGEDSLDLFIDTEGRTSFDSMEPFIISLTAENVGPFDVSDVETNLVGYSGITPQDRGTSLSASHAMATILDKPNLEDGLAGGLATWDWDVYAPFVGVDAPDVEITLTGEVFYRTKSLVNQTLVVVEKDSLDRQGSDLPVSPETNAENGPVSITMDVPDPYVRMVDDVTSFRVTILVINDGTGNVYGRWGGGLGDYDYLEKITLEIPNGLRADPDNC